MVLPLCPSSSNRNCFITRAKWVGQKGTNNGPPLLLSSAAAQAVNGSFPQVQGLLEKALVCRRNGREKMVVAVAKQSS